jgi:hypothetical protein
VLADVEGGGVRVVIVDGALVSITPHEAATAAGVVVTDLATAALEHHLERRLRAPSVLHRG